MGSVGKVFLSFVLIILGIISIGFAFLTGFAGCLVGSTGGGMLWFVIFLLLGLFLWACAVVLRRH
jgi:hypothetical protein